MPPASPLPGHPAPHPSAPPFPRRMPRLPRQARLWEAGGPAEAGLPRTDVFFRSACVGSAAAQQRCGSSAEQSRPATQHPKATAPRTACSRASVAQRGGLASMLCAAHASLRAGNPRQNTGTAEPAKAPAALTAHGDSAGGQAEDVRASGWHKTKQEPAQGFREQGETVPAPGCTGALQQGGRDCSEG